MHSRGRQWNAYETFLLQNASQITSLESSLRSITYFLPGRFKDAELAGEAIYALVHLLSLYHDSVLFRIVYSHGTRDAKVANVLAGANIPKLSLHARYTSYWCAVSKRYGYAARALMLIEATQLLAEMGARRKLNKQRAWDVVIAIEVVKAFLRFTLVRTTQDRPVISPPLPQREFDPAQLERNPAALPMTWRGERTGCIRRSLASMAGCDAYEQLLSFTLTEQDVSAPPLLVRAFQNNMARFAESVWILRPCIYVILLRIYGARDPRPFTTSFVVELLARTLRTNALVPRGKSASNLPPPPTTSISLWLSVLGIENSFLDWLASSLSVQPRHPSLKPVSAVEGEEWTARKRSLWWYLLRGPVWYRWTRPKIAHFVTRTEHRRIIGFFGSIAKEYLPLIDEYYYYAAV